MTEFWHFSCLFNVRNDPTEFENNRTNTSSVILIWLHSLPFSVNQSKVVQLNVCLSTKCRFKKKYMVIIWGVSLFNVWVTVRSTVQNSLSASYLQENCQWQKQNYDFFFSLFFLWISKPQNLTTDKLHSFPASLQSSQQRTVSVFKRMKVSRSVGRPVSWALCCERWAPHFPVNAHWCGK